MQPPQPLRTSDAGIRKKDPPQDAAKTACQGAHQNVREDMRLRSDHEQVVRSAMRKAACGMPTSPVATDDQRSIAEAPEVLPWVLFGAGFIGPFLWVVNIFLPLCWGPRFTISSFTAWVCSIGFLVAYIIVIRSAMAAV